MANLFFTNLKSQVTGGHTPEPFTWYIFVFLLSFSFFVLAQEKTMPFNNSRKRKKMLLWWSQEDHMINN